MACGEESGENRIGMDWINSLTSKKQHHGYCAGFPLFLGISSLLFSLDSQILLHFSVPPPSKLTANPAHRDLTTKVLKAGLSIFSDE